MLEYINSEFRTITKIIMKGDGVGDLVYYYGSDNSFPGLDDFVEYGFKFWIEKYGYGSWSPLDKLPESRKEEIGTKLEDIQAVGDTLFPTLVDGDEGGIRYFGTITSGKQRLILFEVPPGYTTVEMYEKDNLKMRGTGLSEKWYKLLWVMVTSGDKDDISDVSVSYISWASSDNPHRNTNQYLLRNDEIPVYPTTIETLGTLVFDTASFTLLGTKEIEHPLLDEIMDRYRDNTEWDRKTSYEPGAKVDYLGSVWVSCCSGNRGNRPDLSSDWVREDYLGDEYKASRCNVVVVDGNGFIEPSIFTIPKSVATTTTIKTISNPGYTLDYIGTTNPSDLERYESYERGDYEINLPVSTKGLGNQVRAKFSKVTVPYTVTVSGDTTSDSALGELGSEVTITRGYSSSTYTVSGISKQYLVDGIVKKTTKLTDYVVSDGSIVSFTDTLDMPASTIAYQIETKKKVYTASIVSSMGFFVDKWSQEVGIADNSGVIFKFYPNDGDLDCYLGFAYSEDGGLSWRDDGSLARGVESNRILVSSTIVRVERNINAGYLTLEVVGDNTTGKIGSDCILKIWK